MCRYAANQAKGFRRTYAPLQIRIHAAARNIKVHDWGRRLRMLQDLDELVAECPDPRSRKYIREAVQCYKAAAYRASVVACWIALAFDLVDKIREVAAGGDAAAAREIGRFDRARQIGDVRAALAFEKDLLSLARDTFEFISHIEYIDLERLATDRNRCAHPSQVSDTEVFEPSPELARVHIVNATRYVLSQPAAQGKAALDRLLAELASTFFPSKPTDVEVFLRAGALARPRQSLLKNYLSVLLKILIRQRDATFEQRTRAQLALFALRTIHPAQWQQVMSEMLTPLIRNLNDDAELAKCAAFIGSGQGIELWAHLVTADQVRLRTFVENLPGAYVEILDDLVLVVAAPLYTAAAERISRATADELSGALWFNMPDLATDRLIEIYGRQGSFADANGFARRLRTALIDSTDPQRHLNALIQAAATNNQVSGSNQFGPLLNEFVQRKDLNRDEAQRLLENAGLRDISW